MVGQTRLSFFKEKIDLTEHRITFRSELTIIVLEARHIDTHSLTIKHGFE